MQVVAQYITERLRECGGIPGLAELAVVVVDEAVAARDRARSAQVLAEHHRLREDHCRARVAVLAHRKRDDSRPSTTLHPLDGRSTSSVTFVLSRQLLPSR